MKKTSFQGKSKTDLVKALYEKRTELRSARFGAAGSKNRNTKAGHNLKKDVARIMTELNRPNKE
jgi:ribosomal protein L29